MTRNTQRHTIAARAGGLLKSATTVLMSCALAAGVANAQQITVTVGDGAQVLVAGGQVSIPVVVDMSSRGTLDLASITFDLNWDTGLLSFVSASGGGFGSVVFNEGQAAVGKLTTAMFNATGATTNFTVATLVLEAADPLPTAGETTVSITLTAAGSEFGDDILGSVTGVDLVLPLCDSFLFGDGNGDGVVNIIDAQQIARFSVGLDTPNSPFVEQRGSVNRDGVVNIIDAQQIARFSVGLETPNSPDVGEVNCVVPPPLPTGLAGFWEGAIQAPGDFPITMSFTEATDGSVSGTGTIQVPTGDPTPLNMTIEGSRSGSDVTLAMTVVGFPPFVFDGTWDLADALTGLVNGSGATDAPMTATRGAGLDGPDLTVAIASPSGQRAAKSAEPVDFFSDLGQQLRVGFVPILVKDGDPFTLELWTATNQGDAASGDFLTGFFLSEDPTITADDTPLDETSVGSLAAGESSTLPGPTLTIPVGTVDGTYFVGVLVDSDAKLAESDESNNFASVEIFVGPDTPCAVGSVVGEAEPNGSPGEANSVGIPGEVCGEVNPEGEADYWQFTVAAGTTLEMDVDARNDGSPLDPVLELFDTDGVTRLAINDDSDGLDSFISFTFSTGGTYFLKIGAFAQRGGPGNFYGITFSPITQPVDLTSHWQGNIQSSPTSSFPLDFTLDEASDGSVSGSGVIEISGVPVNMTVDGSRSGSDVTLTLDPDGFTPPVFTGIWDGANTMTGVVNESGFSNAPMVANRTSGDRPDLMIVLPSGFRESKQSDGGPRLINSDLGEDVRALGESVMLGVVEPGGTVTLVDWIVRNQGEAASGDFSSGFYLSTDATITSSDTRLDGNSNTSLAPGAEFLWGGPTLTIPVETPEGSYFVGILVDDQDDVLESNEANNSVFGQLDVGPTASCGDGQVVGETEPNGSAGQANTVGVPGAVCGEVNPSGDNDYWQFTVAGGTTLEIDVDAQSAGSPLDPVIELFDTDGATRLAVNDDSDGLDSFISFTFSTGGTYFLKIRGFGGRGGAGFFYGITFTPLGVGITGSWDGSIQGSSTFPVAFSLTENSDGSMSGSGTIQSDNLTLEGSRNGSDVTLTMTVAGFTPFVFTGTWDLANTMTGVVNQSGFSNAPMVVIRTGGGGGDDLPDLVIVIPSGLRESKLGPTSYDSDRWRNLNALGESALLGVVEPGGTVSLGDWIVRNQGTAASGGFSNGFYLSTDPTITSSDIRLDGNSNSSLAPGEEFFSGGPTLTIPAGTPDGTFFVGILVDESNDVLESDETNNSVFGVLEVGPVGSEVEPNDNAGQANSAPVPGSVSGEVNPPGDADFWRFTVSAGTTVEFDVDARGIGSPLDPVLELLDTDGVTRLAFNDDSDGLDSFISFTFATAGTYFVKIRAFAGGGGPGNFYTIGFATRTSGGGVYDIDVQFLTTPTASQNQAFVSAANRWQSLIVGDVTDASFTANPIPAGACGLNHPAVSGVVDDLLIFAILEPIDGAGGILGAAGGCVFRNDWKTIIGIMIFDTADLAGLESTGQLENVILHEMGHVLGLGQIWTPLGFLADPSLPNSPGVDTHFTGLRAINAFNSIGGSGYGGAKVPVENSQGGQGTRDSHWRESVLDNELMTGFLNSGPNPLSVLTVESFGDLGYDVDPSGADAFSVSLLQGRAIAGVSLELENDVWQGPRYVINAAGRLMRVNEE